ncbi:TonB-dependent receptor plug domain-containing protein [Oceanimonas baumannii]|uniref:TonB-dependent receptor plug domain-containing protein n=1 Tax=Oceanimonas baumannii TaxID=129578 RepID=UPI003A95379F
MLPTASRPEQQPPWPASVMGMAAILIVSPLHADAMNVFELGTVVVQGKRSTTNEKGERNLTAASMAEFNTDTVGKALSVTPGVALSHNGRNEEAVLIRGFDSRQVPLFLDGIPQYVPYDGYVDLGRFTTFDLAEIRIAKGAASLLYGPNIMGGAINLVTRRPEQEVEFNILTGVASGHERKVAANIGSNQGSWYLQAGGSYLDADHFPLGRGFTDHKTVPTDTGSHRQHAWRTDRKGSIKLGVTPNETDEYVLSYHRQEGQKGNPVYTGTSTRGIRYWQWPYWNKDSLYLISSTALDNDLTFKTRWYRDTYDNKLEAFTDDSYQHQLTNRDLPVTYNDETYGGAMELISRQWPSHELHVAFHYKHDRHRESNPLSATKQYRDQTYSAALEDMIEVNSDWHLRLGASYEVRNAKEADGGLTSNAYATNGLAELTYSLNNELELFGSVAQKTRIPTIKDRYSARMGRALPNPELQPEQARHLEFGIRGEPWHGGQGEAALFYSALSNTIQNVQIESTACRGHVCDQMQNIGRARHRGIELSLEQTLGEQWSTGFAYSFIDRDNMDNPDRPLFNTPRHRLFAHLEYQPSRQWQWQFSAEAEEGRTVAFSGSGGEKHRILSGFMVVNSKLTWTPTENWQFEVGAKNLTDHHYELADGFPMPGRLWFANTGYRF